MKRAPIDPAWPDDRPVHWRGLVALVGICLVAGMALGWVGAAPDRVERLFVEGFGTAFSRLVSWSTSYLPFSLAEIVYAAIGAWVLLGPLPAIVSVLRRRRRVRDALASGIARVVQVGALALVSFYALWGLNYARAPAIDRLGWTPVRLDDPNALDELERLSRELVALVNDQYVTLHGSDDRGQVTAPAADVDLDRLFDASYARVTAALHLHPSFAAPRGPAKRLVSSPVFSWLGISGIYFPFTGEANVNTLPVPWQIPHTMAHEKAHQRGIASEDEANFFGFLACIHSEDPFVVYSGLLFAQRRLVSTVQRADKDRAKALLAERLPGVQRDVDAANAFWAAWDGWGHLLGQTVNDAYLRSNRVEGGIKSYGLSARLLVAYARQRGGTFAKPPG